MNRLLGVDREDPVVKHLLQKGVVFRVLFDTNVVQLLFSFGEYIYDGYLAPERERRFAALPSSMQGDVRCLRTILGFAPLRSPAIPVVSVLSLRELAETPDAEKREKLISWGLELAEYASPIEPDRLDGQSQRRLPMQDNLPGVTDQLLLGECRRLDCEALISSDYRTILNKRVDQRIERILVLSPTEWWARFSPWWALWV